MEFEFKPYQFGELTFTILNISYNSVDDSSLIDELKANAKILADQVDPHGPDGEERDYNTIYVMNLGSLLSEEGIKRIVQKYIDEHSIDAKILDSSYFPTSLKQIDLKMEINGKQKDVEIRASYSYKTTFERLFTGAFSIIGPYTTSFKPKEVVKDFYIFLIHYYHFDTLEEKLENTLTVHFFGGADPKLFNNVGQWKQLKQKGAYYCVINPIIKAYDAKLCLEKFLECKLFED